LKCSPQLCYDATTDNPPSDNALKENAKEMDAIVILRGGSISNAGDLVRDLEKGCTLGRDEYTKTVERT